MRRGAALRLGLRLVRAGGARGWWSRVLVAVGICLAVVSALVCVGVASVADAQATRTWDRSFSYPDDESAAQAYVAVTRMAYEDRMVLRVDVDPLDGDLPLPPGLPHWPGPGEEFLSPAARALADDTQTFRDLVPGDDVGTVGAAGLRGPDELVAYRGVPRSDLPRGGWAAVGADAPVTSSHDLDTAGSPPGQVGALVLLLAVLVGLPVVAFLHVASRLSAGTRRSRLTVLHFLGASPALVRRVNTVEGVVLAVTGWLAGMAVYPLVNVVVAGSGMLGTTWFASDTALTPLTAELTGVLVVALALVAGHRTEVSSSSTRATGSTVARPGTTSWWRLIPLAIGLASLIGQVVAGGSSRPDAAPLVRPDLLMGGAVLVTAVGLVVAMPALTYGAGSLLRTRGRRVAVRIGGARAAFEPRNSARLVVALALMIMAAGVTIGQTRDARAVSTPVEAVVPVAVDASELPDGAGRLIADQVGSPVIGTTSSDPSAPGYTTAAIATCAQVDDYLDAYLGHGLAGCIDGTVLRATGIDAADQSFDIADLPALATVAGAVTVHGALPDDAAQVLAEGGVDALVTVDPREILDAVPRGPQVDASGATEYSSSAGLVIAAPREKVTSTLATIYRYAPYSQPAATGLDPDSGENIARINGFIRLGLVLGALMTLLALATALADRATMRRRADLDLLVAGTAPRTVRDAHRWEVLATLGAGTGVALVSGVLGGLAWQYAGGLVTEPDWSSILVLTVVSAVSVAVTALVASAAVPRSIDPEHLRTG